MRLFTTLLLVSILVSMDAIYALAGTLRISIDSAMAVDDTSLRLVNPWPETTISAEEVSANQFVYEISPQAESAIYEFVFRFNVNSHPYAIEIRYFAHDLLIDRDISIRLNDPVPTSNYLGSLEALLTSQFYEDHLRAYLEAQYLWVLLYQKTNDPCDGRVRRAFKIWFDAETRLVFAPGQAFGVNQHLLDLAEDQDKCGNERDTRLSVYKSSIPLLSVSDFSAYRVMPGVWQKSPDAAIVYMHYIVERWNRLTPVEIEAVNSMGIVSNILVATLKEYCNSERTHRFCQALASES